MACEQAVLSSPSCFTSSISIKEMLVYIEAAAYLALVCVSFRGLSLVDEKKARTTFLVCVCVCFTSLGNDTNLYNESDKYLSCSYTSSGDIFVVCRLATSKQENSGGRKSYSAMPRRHKFNSSWCTISKVSKVSLFIVAYHYFSF